MCLEVKGPEYLIAEENIPCYKTLDSNNHAHNHPEYKYKKEFVNPLVQIIIRMYKPTIMEDTHLIYEGYHSYVTTLASSYQKTHLFIIPKGTKYYVGGVNSHYSYYDGHVSETIIFVGRNNRWNKMWAESKYKVKW